MFCVVLVFFFKTEVVVVGWNERSSVLCTTTRRFAIYRKEENAATRAAAAAAIGSHQSALVVVVQNPNPIIKGLCKLFRSISETESVYYMQYTSLQLRFVRCVGSMRIDSTCIKIKMARCSENICH